MSVSLRGRVRKAIGATRVWRWMFVVYAIALFVATHWPNLKLDVPMVERPDLFVHMTVFGGWCGLFWLSAWVGRAISGRSVVLSAVIAAAYAGVDEGLQAIPWVHRTAAWDDYGANCLGIVLAAAIAGGAVVWCRAGGGSEQERA